MLLDEERRMALKTLTDFYSPRDFDVVFFHAPKELSDESGVLFEQYFDLLQSLYSLRGDHGIMSEGDVRSEVNRLLGMSKQFSLPLQESLQHYV